MTMPDKNKGPEPGPEMPIAEFTTRAIILGIILAIVFGAANAYVGLKVGMTISASIPAAVISMAILRGALRKGTILENNIVQAIGSSGESLAAGIIFTIPALFFLGVSPSILEMFIMSALGGFLGILFMIPLRRHLIVQEHETLKYPEGTACARILEAGERGGHSALLVFAGALIGGVYKFLMQGLGLWKDTVATNITFSSKPQVTTTLSAEVTPILLGVGYIIGLRTAALMFAGGVLGWFVLIPLIQQIGSGLTVAIPPADKPISGLTPKELAENYVRYIGAGAVVVGGVVSLVKIIPMLIKSFHSKRISARGGPAGKQINQTNQLNLPAGKAGPLTDKARTDRDIPMKWVIILSLIVIAGILGYLLVASGGLVNVAGVGTVLVVILGFIFVSVAARTVGIIGSSSNPVSGMTLTALMVTALVFVAFGWTDKASMVLAMTMGAIICIAVCMSGDISQDLKTGYLVGATPWKMQVAEFIGALTPAIAVAAVLLLLKDKIGPNKELQAPQATLLHMVLTGVIGGNLPWVLIIIGIFIGIAVELLGIASLPFAIGLYLPLSLSVPIMVGGLVAWVVTSTSKPERCEERNERGVLFSSGLVAGDALMGVLLALLATIPFGTKIVEGKTLPAFLLDNINLSGKIPVNPELLGTGMFIALAVFLVWITTAKDKESKA